ncbi:glutathione S-transferase 1-like [Littorina saxatilis]|uniref:Glutathione S-transferase n=1 Tax=Littorina saxatilis TaxID=31220 RepID=A0AAN9GAW6_9CAEN
MPGHDKYRLTYFPAEGRAELIRLIFHAARVPFVDRRITFSDWKDLKPKTPNGSLPVLEIDNQAFDESGAIVMWATRKFGLMGKSDAEELKTTAIIIQANEFRDKYLLPVFLEKDPVKVEGLKSDMAEGLKTLFGRWEPTVIQTESNHFKTFSYMITHSLTAADLAVLYLADLAAKLMDIDWKRFPRLAAVLRTVRAVPMLKEYLTARDGTKARITVHTQTEWKADGERCSVVDG